VLLLETDKAGNVFENNAVLD